MNPYLDQAKMISADPLEQWRWALMERNRNPDPNLANAEHYLWNQYYAGKGPIEAMGAFITPFGYYAGKKMGLLGGRSPATLDQLKMGLLGALAGL